MSGSVIKAGEARMLTRGMYSLDLRDIARDAAAALADAHARGERIVEEAMARAEAQREAVLAEAKQVGYAEGHAEGFAAGRQAALDEVTATFQRDKEALTASLETALSAFGEQKEMFYTVARCDVVTLAIAIARRIIKALPESDAAAVSAAEGACGEALELITKASDVRIRLNPADKAALAALASETNKACEDARHVAIVADENVVRGGAVVETAECEIDGTVATRVERIADELVADWRRRMEKLSLES